MLSQALAVSSVTPVQRPQGQDLSKLYVTDLLRQAHRIPKDKSDEEAALIIQNDNVEKLIIWHKLNILDDEEKLIKVIKSTFRLGLLKKVLALGKTVSSEEVNKVIRDTILRLR